MDQTMNSTAGFNVIPIGHVSSPFTSVEGMPIQTVSSQEAEGIVRVLPEFEAGLQDIEAFEYLILVTHLHEAVGQTLVSTPFLDDKTHGVFATRHPDRPNRIGLSIVKLIRRDGPALHFSGNDMLNGTPVIDIKPYVPAFDVRDTARIGWYSQRINRLAQTTSSRKNPKNLK